jgi:hypothetical protein
MRSASFHESLSRVAALTIASGSVGRSSDEMAGDVMALLLVRFGAAARLPNRRFTAAP